MHAARPGLRRHHHQTAFGLHPPSASITLASSAEPTFLLLRCACLVESDPSAPSKALLGLTAHTYTPRLCLPGCKAHKVQHFGPVAAVALHHSSRASRTMASNNFRDSLNSLGWSRRDEPVNTSSNTPILGRLQSMNPFGQGGYVRLPTTESPGAPLPAPSRREEEEGWFARTYTIPHTTSIIVRSSSSWMSSAHG